MTAAVCPRSFEAEALRDERLDAAQRASFERHANACAACTRELQALERLAEPLRRQEAQLDQLHARRERVRLLAAYDRARLEPEPRPDRRHRWLALPAAAALIAGVALWYVPARPRAVPAMVHPDSTAVWARSMHGDREQVVLKRGALFIRVEHRTATKARFVVVLPDGELEDIGTTFTVSAEGGRTTRVAVQEGSVVLRIRGAAPRAIAAGETWEPAAENCPPLPREPEPEPESISPPRVRAHRGVEPSNPAAEFRAATAVLQAGKPADAAAAFARFGAKFPRDPRAEDASYLRVIALHKLAAADGELERAAQEYLTRFPRGLRRVEVERLAHAP